MKNSSMLQKAWETLIREKREKRKQRERKKKDGGGGRIDMEWTKRCRKIQKGTKRKD